jgi:hypothetical protein
MSSAEAFDLENTEAYTASLQSKLLHILQDAAQNGITDESIQTLLTAGVKLYFARLEDGSSFPPFAESEAVTASEMLTAVSQMMKQVGVELFELGLWQTWTKS